MVLPYTANEAHARRAASSRCTCAPWCRRRCRGRCARSGWRRASSCPAAPSPTSTSSRASSATAATPTCPRTTRRWRPETWTGHTGCVILAPHLTRVTKKEVGLPHVSEATERQQRDGMCWETEDELYNGGKAFKVCARDARGVIVTVIADTYFGYCKKEVKTQISYSANLFGNAEEEHSGGALVFASYNLGQEYDEKSSGDAYSLAEVLERDPERFAPQPEGHADDREQPHIVLVPGGAHYSMRDMTVTWPRPDGGTGSVPLRADKAYLSPNGYRVTVAQQPHDPSTWTLIGTVPNATSCHKPATVSGGGKSEISKAITDAFIVGSAFVAELRDRHGLGHRDPRPRLLPALPRPRAQRHRPAPDPVARPLGGLGHQAAHPVALGVHRRVQRLALAHPAVRQGARLRRQALLPPGVGRRLAQPLQRRRDRRPAGQLAAPRRRQDHPQHAARRLQRRRVVAPVQPAARLLARGEGADPGRHHGIHRGARRPARARPGALVQAGRELREPALPAARRRDPPRLRHGGRARHRDPRHLPVQLRAADPRGCRRDARRGGLVHGLQPPDGRPDQRLRRHARGRRPRLRRELGQPAAGRRRPVEEPALPPAAARPHRRQGDRRGRAVRASRAPDAGRRAAPPPGRRRGRRAAQQPPRGRRAGAVLVRPAALHGGARALHGVHLVDDGQVAVDDRRGLRGGPDQGPVQRPAGDHRPQRQPAVVRAHRARRVAVGGRLRRARTSRSTTTSRCSCPSCSPG